MIPMKQSKKKQPVNGSYTIADIAKMLDVSRPTAIAFVKEANFRVIEVNGTYRVMKSEFEQWFEGSQEGKDGKNI